MYYLKKNPLELRTPLVGGTLDFYVKISYRGPPKNYKNEKARSQPMLFQRQTNKINFKFSFLGIMERRGMKNKGLAGTKKYPLPNVWGTTRTPNQWKNTEITGLVNY